MSNAGTRTYLRGAATIAYLAHQRQRRLDEDDGLNMEFNTGSTAGDMAITWLLILVMVFLSAMFSGLTLGLLGLDKTGLEIVMGGGSPDERKYAKSIYPVREDGNRLLCTLLLGNVAVNALLSITLADIASSLVGARSASFVVFRPAGLRGGGSRRRRSRRRRGDDVEVPWRRVAAATTWRCRGGGSPRRRHG